MTDKKRVFVSDKFTDDALEILRGCAELDLDYRPGLPVEEQVVAARACEAMVIRSATKVTKDFLEQLGAESSSPSRLELIVRAGVGVDNIDLDEATRRGILVQNVPAGNTRSAAEHAVALLLAMARNIPVACATMKSGGWDRSKFTGVEVLGKTLGIVGLGKIGRYVSEMAVGLGFEVLVHDPFVAPNVAEQLGIGLVEDLGDLISRSDFLSVHVPLSPKTRGLIGDDALAKARPGLRIVNCARGGIVDEAALVRALDEGRIAAAAVDVFESEPPGMTELVAHPKVVVTPHLGASTKEAQENVSLTAAEIAIDYLTKRKLHSPINAVQLDPELCDEIEPYRELAVKLGKMQAQLLEGNPEGVVVKYYGNLFSDKIQTWLTGGVLEGFVGEHTAQPVNFINVRPLAREMGLTIEEASMGQSRYFVDMIRVAVTDKSGTREVAGTIRGRSGLRLVALAEYQFDAVLEGRILLVSNQDRPGMIGVVGTALAEHGVNISYMSLGRDHSGGTAIAVVNVDNDVPDDLIDTLAAEKGILWVRQVRVDG